MSSTPSNPRREKDFSKCDLGIYTYSKASLKKTYSPKYLIDVSNFRDPIGQMEFKTKYKDGRAGAVQAWVKEDPKMNALLASVREIVHSEVKATGAQWISIGFTDHHGIWLAPAIAELVADDLVIEGYTVGVVHYELPS